MRRQFIAEVGGREVLVTVEDSPEQTRVTVDDREIDIDCVRVSPGTFSLLIDGRSVVIDIDAEAPSCRLQTGTESVTLELVDAHKHRLAGIAAGSGAVAADGEVIKAPIAGKVIKVLVSDGDAVAAGAGVCALEAMKMENEIRAEHGGTVVAVHVKPGDPVETGQKLLTLE